MSVQLPGIVVASVGIMVVSGSIISVVVFLFPSLVVVRVNSEVVAGDIVVDSMSMKEKSCFNGSNYTRKKLNLLFYCIQNIL